MSTKRYCEMCDIWVSARQTECKRCGAPTVKAIKAKADPNLCSSCGRPFTRERPLYHHGQCEDCYDPTPADTEAWDEGFAENH